MKKDIVSDISKLKIVSEEATNKEAKKIIKDLEDTLVGQNGLGLSAIQIGEAKSVGIIRIGKTKINLINPKILAKTGRFRHQQEGCLSFPGLRLDTVRYACITIFNNNREESYSGLPAVVIQHEIEHMKGRVLTDSKWRKK